MVGSIVARPLRRFGALLLLCIAFLFAAQAEGRWGFSYERSAEVAWGLGHPVLTSVDPYSPASRAGFRVGDVLLRVEGQGTELMSDQALEQLLSAAGEGVQVELQRLGEQAPFSCLLVAPEQEASMRAFLSEDDLARGFAYLSLRDMVELEITYPFHYKVVNEPWLAGRKTFSLAVAEMSLRGEAEEIFLLLKQLLEQKGLRYVSQGGDLRLDFAYSLEPTGQRAVKPYYCYLPSLEDRALERLPLLPIGVGVEEAAYKLNLEVSLYEADRNRELWGVQAAELLSEAMQMADYARVALPVMLYGFPYCPMRDYPHYKYSLASYSWTGLLLDPENWGQVRDVVHGSPAYEAGLRAGDQLLEINGMPLLGGDPKALTGSYISFLSQAEPLREPEQYALMAAPFRGARFWKEGVASELWGLLSRADTPIPFVYLFSHSSSWATPKARGAISCKVLRDGEQYRVSITPLGRSYVQISPISKRLFYAGI